MQVRKTIRDGAMEKVLLSSPVDPTEGVVDGPIYAAEYSAAFGDPVVADLIRTALRLSGLRLGMRVEPEARRRAAALTRGLSGPPRLQGSEFALRPSPRSAVPALNPLGPAQISSAYSRIERSEENQPCGRC